MTVRVAIDDETARWARGEAVRRGISVSALIRELLQREMHRGEAFSSAMGRFLSREARALKRKGGYPRGDDLGRFPMTRPRQPND